MTGRSWQVGDGGFWFALIAVAMQVVISHITRPLKINLKHLQKNNFLAQL